MSNARSRAEQTARIIVEHDAFYIRTAGDPFFFTSGWASPLFIDCKKLISFPDARNDLIELSLDFIAGEIGLENIDSVAGCELAGVPFAAMISDRIERPLVIVRKQGKGFGRLAQFEGHFDPGSKVLLVDDLATDGISKLAFRAALERAEAEVTWTFVLFLVAAFLTSHHSVTRSSSQQPFFSPQGCGTASKRDHSSRIAGVAFDCLACSALSTGLGTQGLYNASGNCWR